MRFAKLVSGERGQSLVFVAAALFFFFAMAAVAVDLGNFYWSYQELLSATQAAAKAGGGAMTDPAITSATGAQAVAYQYSGDTKVGGMHNIHPNLSMTGVNVSFACVSTSSYPGLNMPNCIEYPDACPAAACNAIQVTETATVSTFFAKLFGISTMGLKATATASAGGAGTPYHIVLVLDSTGSMGNGIDTNCSASMSGNYTAEQCAQLGIQSLLSVLSPGTASNPIDEVALMTFPGLMPSETTTYTNPPVPAPSASKDTGCPTSQVASSITSYNNNPGYLIVGFPTAGNFSTYNYAGLNPNSPLVDAVGASVIGNCNGIQTLGGEKTFYAGVIIQAQEYLMANHTKDVQDVIILLSDGDANSASSNFMGTAAEPVTVAGMKNSLFFQPTAQCVQAVAAANWAKGYAESDNTSTEVFAVSYGSESSGCLDSDETCPQGQAWCSVQAGGITPCTTMGGIASPATPTMQYFFSVEQKSGGSTSIVCNGAQSGVNKMDAAFTYIGGELTGSRLIPNSSYPTQ